MAWLPFFLVSCLCFSLHQVFPLNRIRAHQSDFPDPISLITVELGLRNAVPNRAAKYTHKICQYASDESIASRQVISFPEESNSSTVAILKAQSIQLAGRQQPVSGKLELRLPGGFNLSYGDMLRLEGPLDTILDAESPPYRSYLARRGIHTRMQYPQITTW